MGGHSEGGRAILAQPGSGSRYHRPMRRLLCCASIGACLLAGCTAEQRYASGQAWQRNECARILDASERQRCMASTEGSYEGYRREAERTRGAK